MKKSILLMVAFILLLGVVGCGKAKQNVTQDSTAVSTETQTDVEEETEAEVDVDVEEDADTDTEGVTEDDSEASIDWAGTYEGTLPGAGSEIQITLTLNEDNTYSVTYIYVDEEEEGTTETGAITWDDAGQKITLEGAGAPDRFLVGENKLTQLDIEGNEIETSNPDQYTLTKTA